MSRHIEMGTRVGVLGGTFDPVHCGHLQVARAARDAHRLERVLLVPARRPPHKGPGYAEATHRLEMVRLACAGESGLEADDIELQRRGTNFTADTLEELSRRWPGAELFFILGADSMVDFPRWRDPPRILSLARLVVVSRPGVDIDWSSPEYHSFSPAAVLRIQRDAVTMPPSPVASTALRKALREGANVEGCLPAAVADYIAEKGLYRPR